MFQVSIGAVVKAWRQARGLTVTELAARTGRPITKGYLSQLEHNKIRQPGEEHLERLARALDIPVLYLLTRQLPDSGGLAHVAPGVTETPQQLALTEETDREEKLLRRMVSLVDELAAILQTLLSEREQRRRE